jgi:putative transposase
LSWKDLKPVARAVKNIYRAVNANEAEKALTAIEGSERGQKHAAIGQIWCRQWARIIPFFAFGADVCTVIYTTNAIEALNAKLQRGTDPMPARCLLVLSKEKVASDELFSMVA